MITKADFIKEIKGNPEDDSPRLMFADWLMENGQPEWGELIVAQCRLAKGDLICIGMCKCGLREYGSHSMGCARCGLPTMWCGSDSCEKCQTARTTNALANKIGEVMGLPPEAVYSVQVTLAGHVREADETFASQNWLALFLRRGFISQVAGSGHAIFHTLGKIMECHPVDHAAIIDSPEINFGPIIGGSQENVRDRCVDFSYRWRVTAFGQTEQLHWKIRVHEREFAFSYGPTTRQIEAMVDRQRTVIGYFHSKFPGVSFRFRGRPYPSHGASAGWISYSPGTDVLIRAGSDVRVGEYVEMDALGHIHRSAVDRDYLGVALESGQIGSEVRVHLLRPMMNLASAMQPASRLAGLPDAIDRAFSMGMAIPPRLVRSELGIPDPPVD